MAEKNESPKQALERLAAKSEGREIEEPDKTQDPPKKEESENPPKGEGEPTNKEEPGSQTDKEINLRNLAKKREEAENRIQELEAKLQEVESGNEITSKEEYKNLLELLETEYENDPSKFVEEHKALREKSQEFESKLTEKEKEIERANFEKSEAFQKNVKQPIESADERLKGVLRKDEQLYKKILKEFIYDQDGNVKSGEMNADEVIALDEMLEDVDHVKSDRAENAILNMREKYEKANEYYKNFQQRQQEEENERQQQLAQKNQEDQRMARLMRARAYNNSTNKLASDENIKAVLGEDVVKEIGKTEMQKVEQALQSHEVPPLDDLAANSIKARLFDRLVDEGAMGILKDAMAEEESYAHASEGTRPSGGNRPKKPDNRSPLQKLRDSAGLKPHFS